MVNFDEETVCRCYTVLLATNWYFVLILYMYNQGQNWLTVLRVDEWYLITEELLPG